MSHIDEGNYVENINRYSMTQAKMRDFSPLFFGLGGGKEKAIEASKVGGHDQIGLLRSEFDPPPDYLWLDSRLLGCIR